MYALLPSDSSARRKLSGICVLDHWTGRGAPEHEGWLVTVERLVAVIQVGELTWYLTEILEILAAKKSPPRFLEFNEICCVRVRGLVLH